jgi:hypothetical protein
MDTVTMGSPEPGARWPEHLPVGALLVVRWSARYDQTVTFYRDIIGLPVLEIFHDSYGLDGTILGLPAGCRSPGDRPSGRCAATGTWA